jgi:hypothetical protein
MPPRHAALSSQTSDPGGNVLPRPFFTMKSLYPPFLNVSEFMFKNYVNTYL